MRVIIQRSQNASVSINNRVVGAIQKGMTILLGIEHEDTEEDADWLIKKVCGMRIFSDDEGKMNLSHEAINGEFLVVSQFTLHASTKKGNRPSYVRSAKPDIAFSLYKYFISQLKLKSNGKVATGVFGEDMKVTLTNDGPVTIWLDSKNKE